MVTMLYIRSAEHIQVTAEVCTLLPKSPLVNQRLQRLRRLHTLYDIHIYIDQHGECFSVHKS